MQLKRLLAAAMSLLLACTLLVLPASAAGFGAHTADVIVSYRNPDTGEIDDDSGENNAALGEGMCISATGKTALVETDRSGNTWVTIRLLMQSNCSNIRFSTRVGYNEYQEIGYMESGYGMDGDDSVDYRMSVWSEDTVFKCSMFVTPMGRDVTWYLYLDAGSLEAGSGDFNVMIDLNEPAPTETPTEAATEQTQAPTEPASKPTEPAAKPTDPKPTDSVNTETAVPESLTEAPAETEEGAVSAPSETTAGLTGTEPVETGAEMTEKPAETKPGTAQKEESKPSAATEAPAATAEEATDETAHPTKDASKEEGAPLWMWVTVIILAVAAAGGIGFYAYMKKDRNHENNV